VRSFYVWLPGAGEVDGRRVLLRVLVLVPLLPQLCLTRLAVLATWRAEIRLRSVLCHSNKCILVDQESESTLPVLSYAPLANTLWCPERRTTRISCWYLTIRCILKERSSLSWF